MPAAEDPPARLGRVAVVGSCQQPPAVACWRRERRLPPYCEGSCPMPILQLPDVRQAREFDCATAVMTCVGRFHRGRGWVVFDLATPEQGTDPNTVEAVFRKAGWKVNAGNRTLAELADLCRSGRPPICLVTSGGVGHYVVVAGVTPGYVHFHDPIDGMRKWTREEWQANWHDTGRYGEVFREFAVVAWPA